jgi:hypothetical protein
MENTFSNIQDFKTSLISNPELQQQFRTDPVEAAKNINETPLDSDTWIYRIVVLSLGLSIMAIIIGILLLMGSGNITDGKIPTVLTSLGSAAIGALAGLLAPSPKIKK